MNGKPTFEIQYDRIINLKSGFGHKKLCDGLTFTAGSACPFSCTYCYVGQVMWSDRKIKALQAKTNLKFDEISIRRRRPLEILRSQLLTSKGEPRYSDPDDHRVIYGSPLVDVAANMTLVKETVEICQEVFKYTNWDIRLLSKSYLLVEVAKRIPDEYKRRLILGFSTGTLDDKLAASFEVGTSPVSKRLQALHKLQDEGYRTFGMPCPSLPQKDYDKFAQEMASAIRVDQCEHVWGEVMNVRGESMDRTCARLRKAGYAWEAAQLELVAADKAAWEDYSRQTFLAHAESIPAEKLRFMQYVIRKHLDWWKAQEPVGALLLGRGAKTK